MQPETIDLVSASLLLDDEEVLSFLVTASEDQEMVHTTYIPAGLSRVAARTWLGQQQATSWVIYRFGRPVGWYSLGPVLCDCGFDLPVGALEREVWLVPDARGSRIVRTASILLADQLRDRGVTHIVGIAWEDNVSALRGMQNAGFQRLGRGWWEHENETPGWCEVWLLPV